MTADLTARPSMQESYDRYFASSVYDSRYPAPNGRTLRYVRRSIEVNPGPVLDVGAGNGRYAIPIAQDGHEVWAAERSAEARVELEHRAAATVTAGSLHITADADDLDLAAVRPLTALFLFGVLAHMDVSERSHILSRLRTETPPQASIIASVPNARRRFNVEQRTAYVEPSGAKRIAYSRSIDDVDTSFEYSLFTPRTLVCELAMTGWRINMIAAESMLPESVITRRPIIGSLDAFGSSLLPAALGYGLLFTAVKT